MAAQKCVHRGCGKVFTDPEGCHYHPGAPVFHEGQKGYSCCKPRYLTFDEFLNIPPCTTGTHSTIDDTPAPPPKPKTAEDDAPKARPIAVDPTDGDKLKPAAAVAAPQPPRSPTPAPDITEESDEEDAKIPTGAACKRRSCGKTYDSNVKREEEECVHHPGVPLFHEGSKGWTCCKRKVLEFDEFLKIEGCKKRKRHLFVGKPKDATAEEKLDTVRHDFYQTSTTVIVSMYLKKIDKAKAKVEFSSETTVDLDLPTSDGKRYEAKVPLYGPIDMEKSQFKIMGTKLEMILAKKDGSGWPVLRSDEARTGEIIQVGRAGRA